jgi:lysyl-tRNA synthetase class 2
MKPEKREKSDSPEQLLNAGIPAEWHDILFKLGYTTVEKIHNVKSAGKLHQDLCSYNKKKQLGLQNPSLEEVKAWLSK